MACIANRRGRYVIDCYDQHGKRYRKTMKAGTAKEEARKELREIEIKIERRTFLHEKEHPCLKMLRNNGLIIKRQDAEKQLESFTKYSQNGISKTLMPL